MGCTKQRGPVQTSADQRGPARTSADQRGPVKFRIKQIFSIPNYVFMTPPMIFQPFFQIFIKFFFSIFFFLFFSIFFRKNPKNLKNQKYLKNPKKSNKSKKVAFSNFFFDIYVHEIGMF